MCERCQVLAFFVVLFLSASAYIGFATVPDYTAGQQQTFVAPRTEWEQRLADIFKDELHVPQVGAHDNFFDIGGSSLRVISVLQRLQTGFGVQLAPETVYAAPTVAELAKVCLRLRSYCNMRVTHLVCVQIAERSLDSAGHATPSLDLQAETALPDDVVPSKNTDSSAAAALAMGAPRSILLTGATGFLGGIYLIKLFYTLFWFSYLCIRSTLVTIVVGAH